MVTDKVYKHFVVAESAAVVDLNVDLFVEWAILVAYAVAIVVDDSKCVVVVIAVANFVAVEIAVAVVGFVFAVVAVVVAVENTLVEAVLCHCPDK